MDTYCKCTELKMKINRVDHLNVMIPFIQILGTLSNLCTVYDTYNTFKGKLRRRKKRNRTIFA